MNDSQTEKIIGFLEKIVYRNPDNDYFIGRLRCEETGDLITAVGYALEIQPGERICINGQWVINKKYGRQFEIKDIDILVPSSLEGLKKYLGSGLIKGIGPVIAKRIVDRFKMDTLEILESDPDRLLEVEGLAKKRIKLIKYEWDKQKSVREIMIFMQSYGITNSYAIKIYNSYGKNAVSVLKSNPYRLIEDISGIGFKTADRIASNIGIDKESLFRIKSGVIYLLSQMTESGNCYYPLDAFIITAIELLEVGESRLIEALEELANENKVLIDRSVEDRIFLKNIYDDVVFAADKLKALKDHGIKTAPSGESDYQRDLPLDDGSIDEEINKLASRNNIALDDIQFTAVRKAIEEKVLVITGSPGTGKSTILNVIINFFIQLGNSILLGAPTGRASKRLTEATGYEARTIHRMLKYQPKINKFLKNADDPLEADLIVIDEASMLDIRLFKSLLQAIDLNSRLILVGDVDQLPAVGPGNVLSDIINSGSFPVVRLDRIYRQDGNSQIIYNAHRIRDGMYPVLKKSKYNDFFYIERSEPESTVEMIISLMMKRLPENFGYDPVKDIQIIVPTNKGVVGVNNLNAKIQEILGRAENYSSKSGIGFRINDKVIQLKNDYEKEVYNGDIGFIKFIDLEMKEVIVDFDGKSVSYDFYDLDQLSLSYAISIHKSQGSEFKCVLIPILTSHYMLLQRNLLYTAITRAKEVAVLVGSKKAIGIAVNKSMVDNRFTNLKELLNL